MSDRRDYYQILEIDREANAADVKRAYRKLAMELHPDRNPGNQEAESRFKEASEAYQVLSDPERRARYDHYGHDGPGLGRAGFNDVGDIFSAFSDIFGDVFGGGGGGKRGRGPGRGADIETRLTLTLAEAARGVSRAVKVRRRSACGTCGGSGAAPGTGPERCQQCGGRGQVIHSQGFLMISTTCPICRGEGQIVRAPCPTCDGSGFEQQDDTLSVSIPAGVDDGSTLRLAGRGEAAPRGGQPGNLYVVLRVAPDPRFERDGADLHTEVQVSFPQLALGDTVKVATLDGETTISIEPGTQPGATVTLPGRGMPRLEERRMGDLVAHMKLVVPVSLTEEEGRHLRAYADAGGIKVVPPPPVKRGIFGRKKK